MSVVFHLYKPEIARFYRTKKITKGLVSDEEAAVSDDFPPSSDSESSRKDKLDKHQSKRRKLEDGITETPETLKDLLDDESSSSHEEDKSEPVKQDRQHMQ